MKGLLIKDFKLLKNQESFLFTVSAISILFLVTNIMKPLSVIGYTTLVFSMFTISTISYDENDNGSSFLFSLPVSRKMYVKEKYLFGLLLGGSTWIVTAVIATIYAYMQGAGMDAVQWITAVFLYLALFMILLIIILPVQFKFGADKGRIALMGVVACIAFVTFVMIQGVKVFGVNLEDMDAIVTRIASMSPGRFLGTVFLICGALVVISYIVSLKIMEKKEF